MSALNPSDDDIIATVLSIKGCPVEEDQFCSRQDDVDVPQDGVENLLTCGVSSVCCRFAARFFAASSDAINSSWF